MATFTGRPRRVVADPRVFPGDRPRRRLVIAFEPFRSSRRLPSPCRRCRRYTRRSGCTARRAGDRRTSSSCASPPTQAWEVLPSARRRLAASGCVTSGPTANARVQVQVRLDHLSESAPRIVGAVSAQLQALSANPEALLAARRLCLVMAPPPRRALTSSLQPRPAGARPRRLGRRRRSRHPRPRDSSRDRRGGQRRRSHRARRPRQPVHPATRGGARHGELSSIRHRRPGARRVASRRAQARSRGSHSTSAGGAGWS